MLQLKEKSLMWHLVERLREVQEDGFDLLFLIYSLSFSPLARSSTVMISRVSHDLPFLNPCWQSVSIWLCSK